MFTKPRKKKVEKLLAGYRKKKIKIATAESCTGGLISSLLTEISGSSDVFDRGFITYSDQSKTDQLGVPASLIKEHGAVSPQVAEAMAWGALKHSKADLAIAVTGIAGPTGGSKKKPVGLVYIAAASRHYPDAIVDKNKFKGKRGNVRLRSADRSLAIMKKLQAFF